MGVKLGHKVGQILAEHLIEAADHSLVRVTVDFSTHPSRLSGQNDLAFFPRRTQSLSQGLLVGWTGDGGAPLVQVSLDDSTFLSRQI